MVERPTHNRRGVGSIPTRPTTHELLLPLKKACTYDRTRSSSVNPKIVCKGYLFTPQEDDSVTIEVELNGLNSPIATVASEDGVGLDPRMFEVGSLVVDPDDLLPGEILWTVTKALKAAGWNAE